MPADERALTLRAVYNLERGDSLAITALATPNVSQLLGSVFVPYLTTPERLQRHLEMAQLLGESAEHFRLSSPAPRTSRQWSTRSKRIWRRGRIGAEGLLQLLRGIRS